MQVWKTPERKFDFVHPDYGSVKNKDALHDGIFISTARNSIASRATHGVRIMNGTAARFLRLGVSLSGLVVLGWVLTGQAAKPSAEGLPTDWTHRHVIFSEPATYEQVAQVTRDPRYWQQFYRRNVSRVLSDPMPSDDTSVNLGLQAPSNRKVHRDWSQNLGLGAFSGAGNYPAKFSFRIDTANCGSATTPDYVVFPTGLSGSGTQASLVAYDNLYAGCSGVKPTVYWAYNTGGQILTSPVISSDGKQVAFVATNSGFGILTLLKWKAGTGTVGAPVSPTAVSLASYRSCAAPCMTSIFLRDGLGLQTDDTTSSAFPDYSHDIIWVGGARGWLHKIKGGFAGTPAEVQTGGFPVQVKPSNPTALSSPVYDRTSANVFVADYGGFFYRVSPTGVVTASGQVDFGAGLVAGPVVDTTAGKAYVFSSSDGTTACTGSVPCSAVYLFATNFGAGTTGSKAVVGASHASPPNPNPLYAGGFDSTYHASVNATGNLYVCGNTGGPPIMYQVPITAGVFGTVVPGPPLANATTGCSPVSDIPNPNATGGPSEWVFASVQASGLGNSCASGGCILNLKVQPWKPSTAYVIGQQVLDTHFQVQVVRVAGTSRTALQGHPNWNVNVDGSTSDATVRWTNQGPYQTVHLGWQASHAYTAGTQILDSNNNIEWVIAAGTSKAGAHPGWNLTVNGQTADGTVRWRNLGAIATASLAALGGTGGIIMDNTVGSGTLTGASQVYYSTQGDQTCGTTGIGGCAVQASQSALQ
jgi:hypothetical protein